MNSKAYSNVIDDFKGHEKEVNEFEFKVKDS